jgi:hypothetical protein
VHWREEAFLGEQLQGCTILSAMFLPSYRDAAFPTMNVTAALSASLWLLLL